MNNQRRKEIAAVLNDLADLRSRIETIQSDERDAYDNLPDGIWQSQRMTRSEAYAALAIHMEIPENECHFGLFDVARCEIARAWALSIITSKGS